MLKKFICVLYAAFINIFYLYLVENNMKDVGFG